MCLISITVFRNYFCSLRYLPMIENTILHRVVCVYEVVHLKIAHVSWPGARWAGERWEQLLRSAQPRPRTRWPVDTGTQWPGGHTIITTLWCLSMCLTPLNIARSHLALWMNSLPTQIYLPPTKTYFQPFEICLSTAAVRPMAGDQVPLSPVSWAQSLPTLASLTMHKHIFTLIEFEIIITSWCYENLSPLFNLFESASWFLRKYNSFKIEIPVETPQSLKGRVDLKHQNLDPFWT